MDARFRDHHARFLGIDGDSPAAGRRFLPCRWREAPICIHAFAACIATEWDDRLVFSVRPAECEELDTAIGGGEHRLDEKLETRLSDFFSGRLLLPGVSRMYRYTVRREWLVSAPGTEHVRAIGNDNKRLFSDFVANRRDLRRALKAREPLFADRRFFGVWVDGKRAGYAEVSDIYEGGGNIAVTMRPSLRRRGLGRAAVALAAEWCLDREIVPVYWVDAGNVASIRLAESLGFRRQIEEITVRHRG